MSSAMELLRLRRDSYLRDFNYFVFAQAATGIQMPQDIADYMQELRDLPSISNPQLNEDGSLNESSVNWPVPPLWWRIKKGYDV